jgi:imidazoleglycerol-phosphate dehydratase / histidinol-phosphatase
MLKRKILFIDRDGTLIVEPEDKQVDDVNKLRFLPGVIQSLVQFKKAGYEFVMVSNQDGLGTESFPLEKFQPLHDLVLQVFNSQGIQFESIRICPHKHDDRCLCRKPLLGLVIDYLATGEIDINKSFVIGDRDTDLQLADAMGISGALIDQNNPESWQNTTEKILQCSRVATVARQTNETKIICKVDLNNQGKNSIKTGIGFFDHMLHQLASHAGFTLDLSIKGDLEIDDHHTIEDAALVLGEAIRQALGDKIGIARYGFLLPMDDALAKVALDICGRPYLNFTAKFSRERIGTLATEMISHFFRSFANSLGAVMHIHAVGENTHHIIEAIFKAVGRSLGQAIKKVDDSLPSTKGVL